MCLTHRIRRPGLHFFVQTIHFTLLPQKPLIDGLFCGSTFTADAFSGRISV
jgi:hypothetical protein